MKAALVYPEKLSPLASSAEASAIRSYVQDLQRELQEQGHDVSLQSLDGDPLRNMGSAVSRLANAWSGNPPDVVHAHLWTSGLASLAAARGDTGLKKVPIVLSPHNLELARTAPPRSRRWLRLRAAVARDVKRVAASSRRERTDLINIGVRRRDIDVIPHAVNTGRFTSDSTELTHESAPRILAAGPLAPQTGLATAIEALPALPDVELVVVGSPRNDQQPEWDLAKDDEANRLWAIAQRVGVANRTKIIEAPPQDQLPALLRSADVLACTPWYEASNTVELEAMSCGRPVVGSAVGELLDVIIEGTTGVLVPPQNPRALARALHELLKDPIRLNGYAMASARRARARHAWPRIAQEITRAYESAISP